MERTSRFVMKACMSLDPALGWMMAVTFLEVVTVPVGSATDAAGRVGTPVVTIVVYDLFNVHCLSWGLCVSPSKSPDMDRALVACNH